MLAVQSLTVLVYVIRSNLIVVSKLLTVVFTSLGLTSMPVPLPVTVIVGSAVYPLPLFVIVMLMIALPFVLATATACTPPASCGALIATVGSVI